MVTVYKSENNNYNSNHIGLIKTSLVITKQGLLSKINTFSIYN